MNDLISRQVAIDAIESHIRVAVEPYQLTREDEILNYAFEVAASCVYNLPSAEPQPSELARDIATIIEDEMDMRAILRNADAEPCDFCIYNEDCGDMRLYCPARGRKTNGEL